MDNPEEILNVKTIDIASSCWKRSTLAHDQVIQWSKAKVRVYSDSVLCLGKMSHVSEARGRWIGDSRVKRLKMRFALSFSDCAFKVIPSLVIMSLLGMREDALSSFFSSPPTTSLTTSSLLTGVRPFTTDIPLRGDSGQMADWTSKHRQTTFDSKLCQARWMRSQRSRQ